MTQTIEWIYTLKKSVIKNAFNQPQDLNAIRYNPSIIPRSQCIDGFLWWARTKEGFEYWKNIDSEVRYG